MRLSLLRVGRNRQVPLSATAFAFLFSRFSLIQKKRPIDEKVTKPLIKQNKIMSAVVCPVVGI